ncbi:MAG TPA: (d)CMP kinase [Cyclobacteriaceae bacterium]|nr:(d)CMP kinase [Cyclobacteriaceae bacterium]HRW99563.1 (d)CMP kinase [Cyclobacteriaceae bacterium]
MRKIIVAIDGHSACGKSTTARAVASILGYYYVDTGAMYRAVTVHFLEKHVALTNPKEVTRALADVKVTFKLNPAGVTETYLNGLNVEKKIRKMEVSQNVSQISAIREVREAMVDAQRKLGKSRGVVMDGRDIGTVVFPDAELKIFLTADLLVRAIRRQKELLEKDELVDLDTVIANLRQRDEYDSTRKESPLIKAKDAIEIDTTHISIDEQVDEVIRLSIGRMINKN